MVLIETSPPAAVTAESSDQPRYYAYVDDRPDRIARWTLLALLLGTAVLYVWGLSASGYANSFYSAAAQAGADNWTSWFFGSLDSGNSITVDKPPAAIWLMALSVRLFGLSSWSILVPEALLGVASVGVLYATLRRTLRNGLPGLTGRSNGVHETEPSPIVQPAIGQRSGRAGHWAALAGAAVFALTPAATLMFRFNNPDALLVFTLVLASYFTVRAAETASRGWLALAGVAIGLGFLTKMLQAFLVLPALVVAYAIAAPASWRKRVVDLFVAFLTMIVSAGWYIAVVELTPTNLRPYVGGSQNNSLLELIISYNGLGRITGEEVGSVGNASSRWGSVGLLRMFSGVSGGMVSWLIPAALILGLGALVLVLVQRRSAASTEPGRQSPRQALAGGLVLWLGWLLVTGLMFSFMAGIYHDYYTVALAPAIGGAVGLGGAVLWAERGRLVARTLLSLTSFVTGVWTLALLQRAGGLYTVLGWTALVLGSAAGLGLLLADRVPGRLGRVLGATALAAAVTAGLAGPLAYSLDTAATPHTGSIVTAGPVSSGGSGRGGGPGGGRGGQPGMPPARTGSQGSTGGASTGMSNQSGTSTGSSDGPARTGNAGGLLNGASASAQLVDLLRTGAASYTWAAAAVGSQNAASYQLASGQAVMAIGGFNGSDPSPTLAQFQQYVADGRIHYFLGSDLGGRQNGGSEAASEIASWVADNFTATTVGGTTVYDLTARS